MTTADGAVVPTDPSEPRESLVLSLAEVNPRRLQIGAEFQATIRLMNSGKVPVKVPWETDGEKVMRSSGDEESYDVVDLYLRLGTAGVSPVTLKSAGVLFADVELNKGSIKLAPGEWVEVRIRGRVQCGLTGTLCGALGPDKNGRLVARWHERVLTHSMHGCEIKSGNFERRELSSEPYYVTVEPAKEANPPPTSGTHPADGRSAR
jgi:hypothetical protein